MTALIMDDVCEKNMLAYMHAQHTFWSDVDAKLKRLIRATEQNEVVIIIRRVSETMLEVLTKTGFHFTREWAIRSGSIP